MRAFYYCSRLWCCHCPPHQHTIEGFPGYSDTDDAITAGARGSNGPQYGGWRWDGLVIPAGAVITVAYVDFQQAGYGDILLTTLAFENTPTAATFSSLVRPSDRWLVRTTWELDWTWPKQSPNDWLRTPSLAAGIQELVDTYGALSDIVLLEDGTGVTQSDYHAWWAWENDSLSAAKLHIEYTMSDTGQAPDVPIVNAPVDGGRTSPHL